MRSPIAAIDFDGMMTVINWGLFGDEYGGMKEGNMLINSDGVIVLPTAFKLL